MSNEALAIAQDPLHPEIVASLVLDGDIAKLTPPQRVAFYVHRCRELGIDPGEQPFQLIRLNGKLVLYPKKECAQALTRVHRLSVEVTSKEWDESVYIVSARATDPSGQFVDDVGIVDMDTDDARKLGRANAMMKAHTKAKRRAVLSKCGLGGADAEDIAGARVYNMDVETGEITEDPSHRTAIDTTATEDLSPTDRVISLIAAIAHANNVEKRTVYRAAMAGAEIDAQAYGNWPGPHELEDGDALRVAAWLELNRNMKRSSASDARPRPRSVPEQRDASDEDIAF